MEQLGAELYQQIVRLKVELDWLKKRVFDNIFVERLWRTVKYEEVYCKDQIKS